LSHTPQITACQTEAFKIQRLWNYDKEMINDFNYENLCTEIFKIRYNAKS